MLGWFKRWFPKSYATYLVQVERSLPAMDASSAVFPTVREIANSLVLAYYLAPDCDKSALVQFDEVGIWTYGYPNDEGLHQHPLYRNGLKYYEFHRIDSNDDYPFNWIATFHDGTLSLQASDVRVLEQSMALSPWELIDYQFGVGENRILDE